MWGQRGPWRGLIRGAGTRACGAQAPLPALGQGHSVVGGLRPMGTGRQHRGP